MAEKKNDRLTSIGLGGSLNQNDTLIEAGAHVSLDAANRDEVARCGALLLRRNTVTVLAQTNDPMPPRDITDDVWWKFSLRGHDGGYFAVRGSYAEVKSFALALGVAANEFDRKRLETIAEMEDLFARGVSGDINVGRVEHEGFICVAPLHKLRSLDRTVEFVQAFGERYWGRS